MKKRWKKCSECKTKLFLKKHWWHDLKKVICGTCFFGEDFIDDFDCDEDNDWEVVT